MRTCPPVFFSSSAEPTACKAEACSRFSLANSIRAGSKDSSKRILRSSISLTLRNIRVSLDAGRRNLAIIAAKVRNGGVAYGRAWPLTRPTTGREAGPTTAAKTAGATSWSLLSLFDAAEADVGVCPACRDGGGVPYQTILEAFFEGTSANLVPTVLTGGLRIKRRIVVKRKGAGCGQFIDQFPNVADHVQRAEG